jgi:hypothetical protein
MVAPTASLPMPASLREDIAEALGAAHVPGPGA